MATGTHALTRVNLKQILQTLTPLQGGNKVFLGVHDIKSDDDKFANILTNGPYAVISDPVLTGGQTEGQDSFYNFTIKIKVYFGYPANADYDGTDFNDFIQNIWNALRTETNYTTGLHRPTSIFLEYDEDLKETPRVRLTTFYLDFDYAF